MDGFSYSASTKYYIKNDKYYTEDRIPVQELYLYNIPAELSEDEILRHFKSYGNVVRLQLFDTCGNPESSERKERSDKEVKQDMKTGRILFANALDAAKALHLEVHLVNGHQFGAKPSDSWLQPDAYGSSESEQSYITKIPSNLTSIETLRFDIDNETNYERIADLPNLKIVQIRCIASVDIFGKFLDQLVALKSKKLEQLHIHNAGGLTNQMLMQIGKLSVLQKLIIWLAGAISNDILEEFTNLKKLEYICLVDCQNISDSGVLQLILGCPKLRELKLMYCSRITEKLVHDIINNFERQIINKENERHLPIHLYVGGTKIRESINTQLDSTSNNIIKICFVT
ncbi:uncharacterized protein LOC111519586 [Drosophila willistoni]|uniref:uncharacterized protein LOC111519586 n=1 Tax=Drosophila willistoni TaxID=7260 RepID=UPI000C26C938|nr:uncharacterized protein LOC111519586 [Drosophila willistoni]XP_046865574.1 uncharacterized protein LOC111519586 [Drosophila willistoni]XP_046865575.1 uncharacterized protein LOC111519586 [Drosophila willistoni]